jgi:hypothetical protein
MAHHPSPVVLLIVGIEAADHRSCEEHICWGEVLQEDVVVRLRKVIMGRKRRQLRQFGWLEREGNHSTSVKLHQVNSSRSSLVRAKEHTSFAPAWVQHARPVSSVTFLSCIFPVRQHLSNTVLKILREKFKISSNW